MLQGLNMTGYSRRSIVYEAWIYPSVSVRFHQFISQWLLNRYPKYVDAVKTVIFLVDAYIFRWTIYPKKYAHGFCFAVLFCGYTLTDFPYPSGLLHWHCGNLTIAPVPAKQPWWIWINTSCEFIMKDCITTTKQSTTKPCAYFLGYTVSQFPLHWPVEFIIDSSKWPNMRSAISWTSDDLVLKTTHGIIKSQRSISRTPFSFAKVKSLYMYLLLSLSHLIVILMSF